MRTEPAPGEHAPDTGPGNSGWILPAVLAQGLTFVKVMKSKPLEALQVAASLRGFWVVTLALLAPASGLLMATISARLVDLVVAILEETLGSFMPYGMMGGFYGGELGLPVSWWFGLFVFGALAAVGAFALRATAIKLLFGLRGQPQSFGTSARILAVANTGYIAISAVVFLLVLIPNGVVVRYVLILAMLANWVWFGISELLIYVGINRAARFTRSVLVPHVLLSVGTALVLSLVYGLVAGGVVESAVAGY